ncbi:flagellum-associated coiled-coil domain-containing protein 1 isoform X1 [Hyperolius riggenbachi]|uniref:flagellum-associated coiled-coil domain-containing protein 1 isoform X1 n=1 Tax=Hyperolius riggenbachi TaxID=752182 RepID=UPI0035A284DA
MSSYIQYPWTQYVASGSTNVSPTVEVPRGGNRNRPRTSPPALPTFRDPARDPACAKSSLSKKWTPQRLSASRMKSRGSADTDKYLAISPGYSMRRAKDHIEVTLDEDFFRGASPPGNVHTPVTPRLLMDNPVHTEQTRLQKPKKKEKSLISENLVEDLQEQIAKLTALLEQETSEHQSTRRRMTHELEERVSELEAQQEEDMRVLQEKHTAMLLTLQQENEAKLMQETEEADRRYDELQKEMDLLRSSFKTYQESLSEEVNEVWLKKEAKWKESNEEQKMIELSKQRQSLMDVFEIEKEKLRKRALEEQAVIQQSHEAQIEEAWKKYREATQDAKAQNVLKMHLQTEINGKNEAIVSLKMELKQAHEEIAKLKSQIDIIEKNFDLSVSKVESKYKNRIQTLMNEIADLRRKLIAKNEQLYSERSRTRDHSAT